MRQRRERIVCLCCGCTGRIWHWSGGGYVTCGLCNGKGWRYR